ncbi:MAG: RICIN domain-containing protein [Candidatus Aminicenantes bacterium]|nr:MAG: RICIN domain-containing protein [Candidatus Aminicenantes bacterium]
MLRKKGILLGVFIVLFFVSVGLLYSQVLPIRFDWRDYGKVTSVKNQGASGSAPAYATIGSYESAILVDNGPYEDLSEQYLMDCVGDTGIDDGSIWGFPHMMDGTPREDSYSAGGLADLPACFKGYPISAWYYVGDSSSVPNTTDIKQAIYDHGPVCACVYASMAFQAYSGGIFNSCQSGPVNHAIVLVGWDDTGGYWILKNSWGTAWGESGYMRITYGCNQVGYGAAYATVADHRCLGANRWYKFVNRSSGNALDVNSGSSLVYHYPYNGNTDKHWNITAVGSGWVKIENRYSGYALDVGSTNYVYQYPYNGNTDKHWDIIYHHRGYYRVDNRFSGKSLSVGAGVYVYHYPWDGNADKQWEITEVQ